MRILGVEVGKRAVLRRIVERERSLQLRAGRFRFTEMKQAGSESPVPDQQRTGVILSYRAA